MSTESITVGKDGKKVRFYHPAVGELNVFTGLNEIQWGYRLNTAVFPTYGGEVVQILSANIEEMSMGGELRKRDDMMAVYSYFFKYFQVASQGRDGVGRAGSSSYNQVSMTFEYEERGWKFDIQPTAAPEFHVGRDKVVQSWSITAHVVHFDSDGLVNAIKDDAMEGYNTAVRNKLKDLTSMSRVKGDLSFYSIKGEVGYIDPNPFSDPFVTDDGQAQKSTDYLKGQGAQVINENKVYFNSVVAAYNSGSYDDLLRRFESGFATTGDEDTSPDQSNDG